jgi:hypothetical protein
MAASEGCAITASFVYDGVHMENDLLLSDSNVAQEVKAATSLGGVQIDASRGMKDSAGAGGAK